MANLRVESNSDSSKNDGGFKEALHGNGLSIRLPQSTTMSIEETENATFPLHKPASRVVETSTAAVSSDSLDDVTRAAITLASSLRQGGPAAAAMHYSCSSRQGCTNRESLNRVKDSLHRYNESLLTNQQVRKSSNMLSSASQSYSSRSSGSLSQRLGIVSSSSSRMTTSSRHSAMFALHQQELIPLAGGHNATFNFAPATRNVTTIIGRSNNTGADNTNISYLQGSQVSLSAQSSSSGSLQRMAKHAPPSGFKKVASMQPSASSPCVKFMLQQHRDQHQNRKQPSGSSSSLSYLLTRSKLSSNSLNSNGGRSSDGSTISSRGSSSAKKSLHKKKSSKSSSASSKYMLQKLEQREVTKNPLTVYSDILEADGFEVAFRASLSLEHYFLHPTMEQMASYDHDIIAALRSQDIPLLRKMRSEQGRSLQCCNSFGESLIHMSCRRGFTEVTTFLIKEAGVSLRVIDDCGRTPLHDACWTAEPNLTLVELLIREEPDLLLMSDKRGHTPLQYLRREHWPVWGQFLLAKRDLLAPKLFGSKKSTSSVC